MKSFQNRQVASFVDCLIMNLLNASNNILKSPECNSTWLSPGDRVLKYSVRYICICQVSFYKFLFFWRLSLHQHLYCFMQYCLSWLHQKVMSNMEVLISKKCCQGCRLKTWCLCKLFKAGITIYSHEKSLIVFKCVPVPWHLE